MTGVLKDESQVTSGKCVIFPKKEMGVPFLNVRAAF